MVRFVVRLPEKGGICGGFRDCSQMGPICETGRRACFGNCQYRLPKKPEGHQEDFRYPETGEVMAAEKVKIRTVRPQIGIGYQVADCAWRKPRA